MTRTDMQPQGRNTAFPHRVNYVRIDRADDYQPAPVNVPAVTTSGTTVEQAHAAMEHAKASHAKYLASIPTEHYSPEGLRDQVSRFAATDAARAVDVGEAQVRRRADQAASQVSKIRRELTPEADTAGELRATRYWKRCQRLLDSMQGEAVADAARKLMESAARPELGVLLQELPSYIASRGQTADWIDKVVENIVPEYGSAKTQLTKAQQAQAITDRNARSLRASFAQGRAATVLVTPTNYDPDK